MSRKLIKNANVFDGRHPEIKENVHIVVEGNLVKEIVEGEISYENFNEIIDAKNHVVIPGLTDAHVHLSHSGGGPSPDENIVRSVRFAKDMLLRGFTTVRDAGGITYGLKVNIDNGYLDGPRIYPSNAYISQTSGHGDMRESRAASRITDGIYSSPALNSRNTIIADGVPEVLRAVRENLFLGASQIKIMAGGGCSSNYDPIETVQFTFDEMKAAADAASDYGTYVMAHLYTSKSIIRAAKAGIKSFEHTNLMDEEAAEVLASLPDIWVMPGPQFTRKRPEPDLSTLPPAERERILKLKKKGEFVSAGEAKATEAINKYNLNIVFGTDSFGDADLVDKFQLEDFIYYKKRFGNWKTLQAATGNINELIKLSTYQNPYPEGKIGVLEEGSFADILIIDGNPVEDVAVLADRDNIKFIMKDAKVYKNTL